MTEDQKRAIAIVLSGEREGLDAAAVNGAVYAFTKFFTETEPYFDADQFTDACGGLRDEDYKGAPAKCPYCARVGAWTPLHFERCAQRHNDEPEDGPVGVSESGCGA